ncbi:MAG: hypothetical protein PHI63_05175 [Patescibacteria group bacterium]|nr:hypothetical protein [Patescibacteria group bacterium]
MAGERIRYASRKKPTEVADRQFCARIFDAFVAEVAGAGRPLFFKYFGIDAGLILPIEYGMIGERFASLREYFDVYGGIFTNREYFIGAWRCMNSDGRTSHFVPPSDA